LALSGCAQTGGAAPPGRPFSSSAQPESAAPISSSRSAPPPAQPPSAPPSAPTSRFSPAPGASQPEPTSSVPPDYIAQAHWAETEDGPTLIVTPTDAARAAIGSWTAGEFGWIQLEALVAGLAEHPARDSLRHQFICHQQFATIENPDKPTWDLEANRPDVGYLATVEAHCNP
jgi:hypothetical protein